MISFRGTYLHVNKQYEDTERGKGFGLHVTIRLFTGSGKTVINQNF